MGTIFAANKRELPQETYQMVVFANPQLQREGYSINEKMARELLKFRPQRRPFQLEKILASIIGNCGSRPVIRDIDVLFNPAYKVDVLKILISVFKQTPFSVIWPGSYKDGKLYYSVEGHADYKVFDVESYDIICII